MSSPKTELLTPAEYLELERKSELRSEYIAGRMSAMTGASCRHNLIASNLCRELSLQFRGRPCEVYVSDMRVKVSPAGIYTYPDLVAVCGEPRFEDSQLDTLINPMVIVEVLSESTEAYDRGEKFAQYRRIDSIREYVLIAENRIRIEHYVRDGEHWVLSELNDPEGRLNLVSLDCSVRLDGIYEKVDWSLAP